MFTYRYQQPDEYHFSMDSIHLAEYVANELQSRKDLSTLRVLDLCAGCGVIGIELSWYVRELKHFDFVEIQEIYFDYFRKNVEQVNRPELQLQWHQLNYDALLEQSWKNRFDLIISNPPYFKAGQGPLSPSTFKNRCRFYLDSTFENYIKALHHVLAPGGKAYFLLRPLHQHGYDVFAHAQLLLKESEATLKKLAPIRGTDVVLLEKPLAILTT
jgi:tRNA1Val (adenine37-N6)-methyltransferase